MVGPAHATPHEPALRRVVEPVLGLIDQWRVPELTGTHLTVGVTDAQARTTGPSTLIPMFGPGWLRPRQATVAQQADVLVLLDASELPYVRALTNPPQVVVTRLAAPPDGNPRRGLDIEGVPLAVLASVDAELPGLPPDMPGVTWIWGSGAVPAAAALTAWADHRAVVALPGTLRTPLLTEGGTLFAMTPLHAMEATRFLIANHALHQTLVLRGRSQLRSLPSVEQLAEVVAEAMVLAARNAGTA